MAETDVQMETIGTKDDQPECANETESSTKTQPSFKAPTFVIPSKKRVKSNTDAGTVFKAPEKPTGGSQTEKTKSESTTVSIDRGSEKIEENSPVAKTEDIVSKKQEVPVNVSAVGKPQKVLSPAEQLKQAQAAVPYKEPPWTSICEDMYSFEVIKNGAVIDKIDLTTRCYHVVGRLPSCNIPMEHPSLSRHHAIIQYCGENTEAMSKGWYLFDLDSTHGTWINKNKVPPKKFHRLHVDYVLKFGGSTRLFILQGPDSDRQEESDLSPAEMREQREKQKKEAELLRQAEIEEAERKAELIKQREELKGCSWGMSEDPEAQEGEEEEEVAVNPFAMEAENENLYINDPKKALNHYFEREGLELPEYEFHEAGLGKWKCSVELPIDGVSGEPLIAEVTVSGKKKEAVIACALEACRMLDRHGELRKSAQESRKRKQKNWEDDDFYDSDEDTFLDRTGDIEKKREFRKAKAGKMNKGATETYDSLMTKHQEIVKEIMEIEQKLEDAKQQAAAMENEEVDALDAYMSAIKSGMMDTKTKMKFKRQLMELKQEEQKLRKLVNIAKPASLPELQVRKVQPEVKKRTITATVGKIKGPVGSKIARKVVQSVKADAEKERENEIEEESDDENDEGNTNSSDSVQTPKDVGSRLIGRSMEVSGSQVENKDVDISKPVEQEDTNKKEKIQEKQKEVKQVEIKSRSRGSIMPLAAVLEKLQEEAENEDDDIGDGNENGDRNRKRKAGGSGKGGKKSKTGYDDNDPDFAVWLPPENQSGDGKTHLNAKLGY